MAVVPHGGRVYRGKTCVENFIDEKTGKLRRLRVILEGVTCKALYSGKRIFCPCGIYLWREIWLEVVLLATAAPSGEANGSAGPLDSAGKKLTAAVCDHPLLRGHWASLSCSVLIGSIRRR
jgi:hypothetical protein